MESDWDPNEGASERETALSDAFGWNVSGKKKKKAAAAGPPRTSNQLTWEEQYDIAWKTLQDARDNVEKARKEYVRLTEEAANIRNETQEYLAYMEKKTSKRHDIIVSINDENHKEIEKIKEEDRQLQEEFEKQKDELRDKILMKENLLASTQLELNNLDEYRDLQQKQTERIQELQAQVARMQVEHSEAIQQLKAQFLVEKRAFEEESEETIAVLSKQAKKEATDCLNKHSENSKKDNREMRQQLLELIEATRALHIHKLNLEKQKKELIRELQYNDDVKHIRHAPKKREAERETVVESKVSSDETESTTGTPSLEPRVLKNTNSNKNKSQFEAATLRDGNLAARLHITKKLLS